VRGALIALVREDDQARGLEFVQDAYPARKLGFVL
jgi:hypothetical protein